jgi:hypothetical protein
MHAEHRGAMLALSCWVDGSVKGDWVRAVRRVLSAMNSPWFWPVLPVLAVAMVGQWVSVIAAEVAAAACAAVGIGIVIGLVVAGERGVRRVHKDSPPGSTSAANPDGPSANTALADAAKRVLPRATDLRGALLANTTLVGADLRHADLRGAILTGADLSGANLTDARLGPLDGSAGNDESA